MTPNLPGAVHTVTRNPTLNAMHNFSSPRVTPADVAANISAEFYFTAHQGANGAAADNGGAFIAPHAIRHDDNVAETSLRLLTFCVLVLKNGFTVTGEAACVSPKIFDAEIGREIARENAVHKVWPLMGYALKEKLHHSPTPAVLPHPLKDFYG